MQQYVIFFEGKAFTTNWYQPDNNHVDGMTVVDLLNNQFTTDGQTWQEMENDNL